ncbi:hypothetical protein [Stenotrophomonas maltophilia]|uniref:hypothetical protein n=1 Tax=Stenotrophomonas maltophilia TaxID=40324 RepID=UPI0015DE369F|nr:hypothetical protein [Stenotrophomonas maltophilia]
MNRVRSRARHHRLISAGIAGAVTLAGSCLLPVLLVIATVAGAAVQFLVARVLASRWLRVQAS